MSNPENPRNNPIYEFYIKGMADFIEMAQDPKGKVKTAIISGKQERQIETTSHLGFFHPNLRSMDSTLLVPIGLKSTDQMINKIAALDAKRILKIPTTRDDDQLFSIREKDFTLNGLPYMVVVFGNGKSSGREITMLFYADGICPLSAFIKMKKSIKDLIDEDQNALPKDPPEEQIIAS